MIFEVLLLLGGGVFCIWAALTEQPWFFKNYKARSVVRLFGMNGAKIFYTVLGAVLCIAGLFALGHMFI